MCSVDIYGRKDVGPNFTVLLTACMYDITIFERFVDVSEITPLPTFSIVSIFGNSTSCFSLEAV